MPSSPDPLDQLREAQERLRDADDCEETTARHDAAPVVHVHLPGPQPSQPEITPEAGPAPAPTGGRGALFAAILTALGALAALAKAISDATK